MFIYVFEMMGCLCVEFKMNLKNECFCCVIFGIGVVEEGMLCCY